jgi:hypothetical protein
VSESGESAIVSSDAEDVHDDEVSRLGAHDRDRPAQQRLRLVRHRALALQPYRSAGDDLRHHRNVGVPAVVSRRRAGVLASRARESPAEGVLPDGGELLRKVRRFGE